MKKKNKNQKKNELNQINKPYFKILKNLITLTENNSKLNILSKEDQFNLLKRISNKNVKKLEYEN